MEGFANNLGELKNLVDMLISKYGADAPLEAEIGLGGMPGDCHKKFIDKGFETVIEVSAIDDFDYNNF